MSKFGNTRYHSWFKLRSVNIHWHPQTIDNEAEFAFSIYDEDGTNVIDAVNLGNVLRALNLNPTNATIEKLGGTKKKGEKKLKLDEFLPIFSQCKKDKEQGCYEDFLECERLTDAECDEVIKDCMDAEDEDGFIPYARKYQSVLNRNRECVSRNRTKSVILPVSVSHIDIKHVSVKKTVKNPRLVCLLLEEDDGAVVNSEGVIKTMIIHPFLRRLCERATATDDD
ncbi:hypothetical protein DMN91_007706 [Ooceraea biroi]|uniref:Myosin light chain alkali n=1 Tax=Ooceraea biroi TaxID=2015173 RepID=A0A3L8DKX6_OOCBI|nr:hypothetical protein DMN91_007706 [Ooceraea biroi]